MIYVSSLGKHLKKLKLFCNTEMSELKEKHLFSIPLHCLGLLPS